MRTNDIRKAYLNFFAERGHKLVPSARLIPENDPTTLFTGSGMQPMLPYFLGEKHPLGTRITDSQKCFRTQDIEEVGDNRHTTFFEMLGNWSFGDYFKKEQLLWFFEFLTKEIGIAKEKLWVTCFEGDEKLGLPKDTESAVVWESLGIPKEHIRFYGSKKNWWSRSGSPEQMPTGEPGGPDSEVFYEFIEVKHDPQFGAACHPNCDCGRFLEIGNSVFMEYIKQPDGSFGKLPKKNVDFGGGLERIMAAKNDNPDIFEIDLFDKVRNEIEKLSEKKYGEDEKHTFAFRVVMDHLRAAAFLIGDGVLPSNKDQGYFVRRLIRRAIRFGKELAIAENFVGNIVPGFIEHYKEVYPMLHEKQAFIQNVLSEEEEKFRKTLDKGLKELERRMSTGNMSGKDAFEIFSTYGFPLEMTQEIVREKGRAVDEQEFRKEFMKHQELSRTASAGKFKGGLADHSAKVTALHTVTHLMLAGLRKELGDSVHQAGSNITEERTRFDFTYPEKVSREILDRVETYVNTVIDTEAQVTTEVTEKEIAKKLGIEGSFWEKYPEKVTVYQVAGPDGALYSRELCGGPHVTNTRDIAVFGHFKIIKEEACSAGVRRIKAILK